MQTIFTNRADKNIESIIKNILIQGYPDNAIKFKIKLYEFGRSLSFFPEKYPICRFEYFNKRNLRCAVYQEYIFIYKIDTDNIIIQNVIHSRLMK